VNLWLFALLPQLFPAIVHQEITSKEMTKTSVAQAMVGFDL
jgi:hypothetical protein